MRSGVPMTAAALHAKGPRRMGRPPLNAAIAFINVDRQELAIELATIG